MEGSAANDCLKHNCLPTDFGEPRCAPWAEQARNPGLVLQTVAKVPPQHSETRPHHKTTTITTNPPVQQAPNGTIDTQADLCVRTRTGPHTHQLPIPTCSDTTRLCPAKMHLLEGRKVRYFRGIASSPFPPSHTHNHPNKQSQPPLSKKSVIGHLEVLFVRLAVPQQGRR